MSQRLDCQTHSLFIAEVVDAAILNDEPSVNYSYYLANIKEDLPTAAAKGWKCKICGYVYEGDPLPPDFICPLCKHGVADFVKI